MDDLGIQKDLIISKDDEKYSIKKALLTMIPLAGSAISEFFSYYVTPPLTDRQNKWIIFIYEGLQELKEKYENLNFENIFKDDKFFTTFLQASHIAIRSHQKEKLEALRSTILNDALPESPDEDLQLTFLDIVDSLSVSHLKVLLFNNNPKEYIEKYKIACSATIDIKLNESLNYHFFGSKKITPFGFQVGKDLNFYGLLNTGDVYKGSAGIEYKSRTTKFGNQFVKFITSPIEI